MNKIPFCACLALMVACGNSTKKDSMKEETTDKGLDLSAMDSSVRPQDDFYNFVNGGWMKTNKIPADKPSWGTFYMLREETDEQCLTILDNLLKEQYPAGSEGEKIQILYKNYMDMDARNKAGLTPLGENPICGWGVYADMKDSNQNTIYLGNFGLGLGRDYYQKESDSNTEAITKYQTFVTDIFKLLGEPKAAEKAAQQVAFEKDLAKLMLTNEEDRDPNRSYNPQTMEELSKLVKNLNLPAYLKKVGVNTDKVVVSEIRLYKEYDKFLNEKNLPLIKDYLRYQLVANNATNLDATLDELSFDFYSKYLRGQQEQRPMNKRALSLINGVVGEAFGKLYVEKYFPAKAKEEMVTLVGYLNKSFAEHIKNVTWMSAETKEKALHKLSTFKVKVGYPDKWEDYSKLQLNGQASLFENLREVARWAYQKSLEEEVGKPVDKSKWGMTPQTVNAYYNPLYNEIVFPAAILQPPFFNFEADPAVNFGGIGAVIGHETTHGFDDSGAEFDAEGNLQNWWTPADKENFEKVTAALAKQFDQYEPVKGIFVNGIFTNGENIADRGGVNIAYDALQMYLNDHGKIEKISNFTQEQRFFISWATVWRTLSTDAYMTNQVKTDPHTPGYFRAFAPLTNVDSWYKAFDVKEGDKLYKKPEDRIKIW